MGVHDRDTRPTKPTSKPSQLEDDILATSGVGTLWMPGLLASEVVRGQKNDREACVARIAFKLLDDRLASVRLLMKDYGVQFESFEETSSLFLQRVIVTMNNENVTAEFGCGLRQLGIGLAQVFCNNSQDSVNE